MFEYIPDTRPTSKVVPDKTINKATQLLPQLFDLLGKYDAAVAGDSEQEMSSIIMDGYYFSWLDDNEIAISTCAYGYPAGKLINK